MNQKCYIAGKATGLKENEYRPLFESAAETLRSMGYDPIIPIDLPHDHDKTWQSYMKECTKALIDCDAIMVLYNWASTPGARFEEHVAMRLGIKRIN